MLSQRVVVAVSAAAFLLNELSVVVVSVCVHAPNICESMFARSFRIALFQPTTGFQQYRTSINSETNASYNQ